MIAIILKQLTSGIYVDAKIIKKTIEDNTDNKCKIIPWDKLKDYRSKIFDIKIIIEHLTPEILKIKSKKTIFKPNLEFLTDWDIELAEKVDIILCKTKQTKRFFDKHFSNKNSPKIVYSKFTSLCTKSTAKKDFNIAVHFAGKSFLKGTDLLVKYWLMNNGFLDINPDLILIVTFKPLKKHMKAFWYKLEPEKENNILGRTVECERVRNVYMVEYLSDKDLAYFREKAGIHICPSLAEGYGHYINEGRCNKSLVITTDASPMNELITDKDRLIKVHKKIPSHKYINWLKFLYKGKATVNFIDYDSFTLVIKNVLKMNKTTIKQKINKDHKKFINDTNFYRKELLKFINY